MVSKKSILISLVMLMFGFIFSCKKNDGGVPDVKLFEKLNEKETNVSFNNKITETEKFNILDYLYFYNGGGVSAGDINNDGLVDLFFVSNQGKNKLYINKGAMKFEDITEKAGVEGLSDWKTGSTMVDINADGFLDIYTCTVGNFKGLEGSNELYINNGDNTFTEKANQYGLDFTGFSTQAAFFDYDKDGDLDCYLLNHAVHTSKSYDRVNTRMLKDNEAGDYLYRNDSSKDKPRFTDVSKEAGIYQASMGYGLGISVADINNDGWDDIYVSNDFHEDDYYYVNNKNGTFKEELRSHFKHTSRFSMGSDIADINNDGYQDIMTLDMYPEDETVEKSSVGEDPLDIYMYKLQFGYFNQYSRNCLQLNMGGEKFSDIAPMSGVMATDWSWSTLMADYDGDGIKDIFVSNGIVRRPNNLDYVKFIHADSLHFNVPTSAKLDQEAMDKMPSGKVHNYLFRGTKSLAFEDKSMTWGFDEAGISNGSAYADLDNDGDLDLITNNIDEAASIYKNNSRELLQNNYLKIKLKGENSNTNGIGAKVIIKTKDGAQMQQLMPTRGFISSVEPSLLFGIGKNIEIDSLIVIWESNKKEILTKVGSNETLTLSEKNAKEIQSNFYILAHEKSYFEDVTAKMNNPFIHKENTYFDFSRESLMPFKVSTEGPKMAVGDVNGDGKEDFFVGGAKYQPGELYVQSGNGFSLMKQPSFQADSIFEDVDAAFIDVDNDKDLDLYVVSGGNEFFDKMEQQFDRLYLNDGKGNFTKNLKALPPMYDNKSCVKPCDFDKDGDIDLFVGGRVLANKYGKSPNSYLLVNNGKGIFKDVTLKQAPALQNSGMITSATWADLDKDGDHDLTVVGDWMGIKMFENAKGNFKEIENGLADKKGFWSAVEAADFDNDGDMDLIVGNLGPNNKFRKEEKGVLKMLINDIDKNESMDQIVAYSRGNKWYPTASKDEMGKQLPSIINKRFTDNKDYAGLEISDIFEKKELENAQENLVKIYESVYLENTGNGKFNVKTLPSLAQVSKIMSFNVVDFDKDGKLDVILGGNFYGANMYQARYDASFGLILKGDGKGGFSPILPTDSGLMFDGEVRDIKSIMLNKVPHVLVSRNNEPLQIFKKKSY